MKNKNCLAGMACPHCKSQGPFSIQVHCIAQVRDDGIEITSEHTWDDSSFVSCDNCYGCGDVHDFTVKNQKKKAGK